VVDVLPDNHFVVTEIFPVSFLSGRVLRGVVVGKISKGDILLLESDDYEMVSSALLAIDPHRRMSAPDGEWSIVVGEPLSSLVVVGSVLLLENPSM
jgi:hypothetical protein